LSQLSNEPDRLFIRKKDKKIYDRILEKGSPLSRDNGFENKDIFMLAMSLGHQAKNRKTLDMKLGYFLSKNLDEDDKATLSALAIAEEKDLEVLVDMKRIFQIAEEYAVGGIHLLNDKVFSGIGSFSKRFESLLVDLKRESESMAKNELASKINELIRKGENEKVEFKSSLCWGYKEKRKSKIVEHSIAKVVSAFMNSEGGGTLLIGVSDDRQILGLQKDLETLKKADEDAFELHFTHIINNYLGKENRPSAKMRFAYLGDKIIAVVEVDKNPSPVFLTSKGKEDEFYIRSGNSSQPLNVRQGSKYIEKHW